MINKSPLINFALRRYSTSPFLTTSPSSTMNFACPPVSAMPTALRKASNSMYYPEMVKVSVFMRFKDKEFHKLYHGINYLC